MPTSTFALNGSQPAMTCEPSSLQHFLSRNRAGVWAKLNRQIPRNDLNRWRSHYTNSGQTWTSLRPLRSVKAMQHTSSVIYQMSGIIRPIADAAELCEKVPVSMLSRYERNTLPSEDA